MLKKRRRINKTQKKTTEITNIAKFSSYRKVLRVFAYVLRFIDNCKVNKHRWKAGPLQVDEIQKASIALIKNVQHNVFKEEIHNMTANPLKRLPLVRQLRLYLDKNGLIRCAGRIDNASVSTDVKYPYLLPSKHPLTDLIVMDAHRNRAHVGLNGTITEIQQTFWIPKIRQRVKTILRSCVACRKIISRPYTAPDPPPLPKDRLGDDPPFSVTGVDFTGALNVKQNKSKDTKVYLCLFTCATTRAVHIEIVPDLTENSFMLAFRRFISRRSLPRVIISDNASTFKCAAADILQLFESTGVHEKLAEYGTKWKFIPNRAPWYGGWWERLIGLTKNSLKTILGRANIELDKLSTIVTEIECTLNDRPLTYISTDLKDPEPLTPSHLLYGRRLNSLPYPILQTNGEQIRTMTNSQLIRKTQHQQDVLQRFWVRWRKEYLTSLREFHKAYGDNRQKISVGDFVQIHEDSPRISWKIGLIEDLVRGGDGLVRSATVRTKYGLTNRPIVKLYPLEVNANQSSTEFVPRRSERLQKRTF